MKGTNVLIVDQLLMNLSSFHKISNITGWDNTQIMNYVDSVFRYEHPKFYSENIKYFCWGQTDSERAKFNKKAKENHIRELLKLKEDLCKLKEQRTK